jgi:hypothetical protein
MVGLLNQPFSVVESKKSLILLLVGLLLLKKHYCCRRNLFTTASAEDTIHHQHSTSNWETKVTEQFYNMHRGLPAAVVGGGVD